MHVGTRFFDPPRLRERASGFKRLNTRLKNWFQVFCLFLIYAFQNATCSVRGRYSAAEQIGAVNTLVRRPDGTLKGYNTDYSAAIGAIELAMSTRGDGGVPLRPTRLCSPTTPFTNPSHLFVRRRRRRRRLS